MDVWGLHVKSHCFLAVNYGMLEEIEDFHGSIYNLMMILNLLTTAYFSNFCKYQRAQMIKEVCCHCMVPVSIQVGKIVEVI